MACTAIDTPRTMSDSGYRYCAARVAAGNFVPFVVWFNFLAGFVYVAAGVELWL